MLEDLKDADRKAKSGDRLRVALISYDFGEYCSQLASALAQHAEVLLALPEQLAGPYRDKLDDAVHLFPFPSARIRQAVKQFRTIRMILQRVREFAPDVVHYQGVHLWFDLALPLFRRYPLAFTIHDFRPHPGDQPFQQTPFWIEMFARRCADQLIVHSRRGDVGQFREAPRIQRQADPRLECGPVAPGKPPSFPTFRSARS